MVVLNKYVVLDYDSLQILVIIIVNNCATYKGQQTVQSMYIIMYSTSKAANHYVADIICCKLAVTTTVELTAKGHLCDNFGHHYEDCRMIH